MSLSELAGLITGVLCVWLGIKELVWAWPIGLANNAIYLIIFWRHGLYAIALLQLVYAAISIYGWWNWLHGGSGHSALSVSRAPVWMNAVLAVCGVLSWLALVWVLRRYTDSTVPGWDALTTTMSIVAQFMLSRKWLENWPVWLVVDVIYIALAVHKQLYLTSLLYCIFLVLCTGGWIRWLRVYREQRAAVPAD